MTQCQTGEPILETMEEKMKRIVSFMLVVGFFCLAFVSCRDTERERADKESAGNELPESTEVSTEEIIEYLYYIDGMIKDTEIGGELPKLSHNGTEYTWNVFLSHADGLITNGLNEDELFSYTNTVLEYIFGFYAGKDMTEGQR